MIQAGIESASELRLQAMKGVETDEDSDAQKSEPNKNEEAVHADEEELDLMAGTMNANRRLLTILTCLASSK